MGAVFSLLRSLISFYAVKPIRLSVTLAYDNHPISQP